MTRRDWRLPPLTLALVGMLIGACTTSAAEPSSKPNVTDPSPGAAAAPEVERSIVDVLADRGLTCLRTASISRRPPSAPELQTFADAAAKLGDAGGWLSPEKDALAPGQVYIGTFEGAAKALAGEIVGLASDQWILTERSGQHVAIRLTPIDLAGPGVSQAWVLAGRMAAVPCSSA